MIRRKRLFLKSMIFALPGTLAGTSAAVARSHADPTPAHTTIGLLMVGLCVAHSILAPAAAAALWWPGTKSAQKSDPTPPDPVSPAVDALCKSLVTDRGWWTREDQLRFVRHVSPADGPSYTVQVGTNKPGSSAYLYAYYVLVNSFPLDLTEADRRVIYDAVLRAEADRTPAQPVLAAMVVAASTGGPDRNAAGYDFEAETRRLAADQRAEAALQKEYADRVVDGSREAETLQDQWVKTYGRPDYISAAMKRLDAAIAASQVVPLRVQSPEPKS